jgi:hypothetical protein
MGGGGYQSVEVLMPEWVGTILFLIAVGLSGEKLVRDFGDKGMLGYGMLIVMIAIYSSAVGVAFA